MKFNIDDYKGKYAMHCKTKEEAEDFCRYLDSIGHMWGSGESYLSRNNWNTYRVSTCYSFNTDTYCSKQYFKREGYTILEMEDFMSDTMSNKDRINKVFEILGVKPYECFNLSGNNSLYYIDYELNLHCRTFNSEYKLNDHRSNDVIVDILRGKKVIVFCPTKEEQLAIDYAKTCGYKWLAKDNNNAIYAYKEKPKKKSNSRMWDDNGNGILEIELPISFLSWEDEEPYYIGD